MVLRLLSLVEHYAKIVLVHLGRDRAVQHGLQKAADGSQRGSEIVGDVGDEFLLVILGAGHCFGHVADGSRQIAQFVVAFHIHIVVHVAGGILLRRSDDLPQGTVDQFREEEEDDQREKQNHDEHHIGNVQHAVSFFVDLRRRLVDDHIAPGLVVVDDRRDHAEFFFLEGVKEGASCEVILLCDGGIEALHNDLLLGIGRAGRIDDHSPGRVDDPDLRVHEIGEGLHLLLHGLQRDL